MAKLKDLKVTIGLSKSGLTKLNADLRRVKGNFRRNFGEITALARQLGTILVTSVGAGLTAIVKAGAKLQTMEVSFRSIMGSAEGAADMVAKLNKFTAATPFRLEEVSRSARNLLAVGISADDVQDRLRMLGDIAAASGNSISDIAAAFAKVQAKGKVELENLNQLAERSIPIFDALRQVTGDANMEFGAGAVSVEQYNEALRLMVEQGGFAEDAMKNLSETVDGKLSTALDNVEQALGKLAQRSGVLEAITGMLDDATYEIQRMSLSTEDLQKARNDLYDLAVRFKTAHKGNAQQLRDEVKEAEKFTRLLVSGLGADVAGSHLKGVLDLLNRIDEAMAFGTLPDAPTPVATAPKETKEEFEARLKAAAEYRENQEGLNQVLHQQIVLADDLAVAQQGLRDAYGGLKGELIEVAMAEEEIFDEGEAERIAYGTNLIQRATFAAQNMGAAFGITSGLIGAAFDNIKDRSQGFHIYLKSMLEDLLKKALALAAAFAAMSIFMGPTAMAKGVGSFGSFMKAGLGFGNLPMMSEGGLFAGPSLAMVGEGAGTSMINPEVVAPLNKLQNMLGGGNVTVTGRIDGRDILISSERAGFDRNRVRGF